MSSFLKDWLPYVVIVIVIVLLRTYIITPVIVRGDSMNNTLNDGEVLLLSKISYRVSDIKRFDIVVIEDDISGFIIKRVIGLPGDDISYVDDILYINGQKYTRKFTDDITDDFTLDDICRINGLKCNGKIPDDMYLVLGDNRDVSADSRSKGLIERDHILGQTIFRLWPFNRFGAL